MDVMGVRWTLYNQFPLFFFHSSTYYSHLKLNFQTSTPDGLLFMNARLKDANSDQLMIGLDRGRLKIVFVLDGAAVSAYSDFSYGDGKPHKLIVSR